MYSYVLEFELAQRGEEAKEYLADAVRSWPNLWEKIPGVTRTLMLCSAFGLGGTFTYAWRVDMNTLGTLSRIDQVMKSGEGGWRETRQEWFKARTARRGHMLRHLVGNEDHLRGEDGTDGAIHLILNGQSGASTRLEDRLKTLQGVSGVVSAQALRPVLGSDDMGEQIWLRLEGLESLDSVAASDNQLTGDGRVFGEVREVDGALFVGA
ncbi:hypothetical protein ACH47C_19460 [Streptomyces rishiriensis]|uniref:hypothetical protein n=1 Tax=Streptomyces rishiriensis TaxID=68264 RepID=UPI00340BE508